VPSYGGEKPRFRPWKCRTGTSSSIYSLVSLKSGVIKVQYLYLKFGCPVSETNQQCCSIFGGIYGKRGIDELSNKKV